MVDLSIVTDETHYIEFVQPGIDGCVERIQVAPSVAIRQQHAAVRHARPDMTPLNDIDALDSFIVVHWAKVVPYEKVGG